MKLNRLNHWLSLLVLVVPFAGVIYAIVSFWHRGVDEVDLALMFALYALTAMGITLGFHRMLTHRSFEAGPVTRTFLIAAGTLALEGPPLRWVADHREHHDKSDDVGDPHSPHVGHGGGLRGTLKGLWHAHIGWVFVERDAPLERYVPDLLKDPVVVRISKLWPWFAVATIALPFVLGLAIKGSWTGAANAMIWAGAVRIFLTHHLTWSINSICHVYGRREFDTGDMSTNNWLLALPTFGEAWHHNHHAFPTSAFHGLKRWQAWLDPSGWILRLLEKLGLVWGVKRVSPVKIAAKKAEAVAAKSASAEPAGES